MSERLPLFGAHRICMYDFTIEELKKLIVPQNNETEWKKEESEVE